MNQLLDNIKNGKGGNKKAWTLDETLYLIKELAAKKSTKDIAATLGRTEFAVNYRVRWVKQNSKNGIQDVFTKMKGTFTTEKDALDRANNFKPQK